MIKKLSLLAALLAFTVSLTWAQTAPTISVTVYDRGTIPAAEGSYSANRWTAAMTEKSGVNVKWVPVPRWTSEQAYTLAIASGEVPDLIVEYDRGIIGRLIDTGAFQPVDQLIQKYSVEYKAYAAQYPELKPYFMQDGQQYAFGTGRTANQQVNHAIQIRQDWLDKLGLKMPTTDDELLAVGKAFKEKDPDGNGKADTYGFAFNAAFNQVWGWYQAFGGQWYLENGQLKLAETSDRYGDGTAFMKKAYDAGLIDPEYFTDTTFARQKQAWVTGKAGMYLNSYTTGETKDLMKADANAKISYIGAVKTKYGNAGLLKENGPLRYILVSAKTKNPQAIFKFIDWMLKEGDTYLTNGVEGVHYKMVGDIPTVIDPAVNKVQKDYVVDYAIATDNPYDNKLELAKVAADPIALQFTKMMQVYMVEGPKVAWRKDIPYAPTTESAAQVMAQFGPIIKDLTTKAIVGGTTISVADTTAKLKAEWKRLGGENVEKEMMVWYNKNKSGFVGLK